LSLHLRLSCSHAKQGKAEVAGGISIHAVDVASGRPAQGLRVEIWRIEPGRTCVAEGRLEPNGVLDHPVVRGAGVEAGVYEVLFHVGEFFGEADGFLTVTPFRFRIADVDQHFHLPLKFTRWGYSLFRGA
jgi:5-hydroxyisourate hydrolase